MGRGRAGTRLSYRVGTKLAVSHPCSTASPPDSMTRGLSFTRPVLGDGLGASCASRGRARVAAMVSCASHNSFGPHAILIAAFSQLGKLRLRRASDLSQIIYAAKPWIRKQLSTSGSRKKHPRCQVERRTPIQRDR